MMIILENYDDICIINEDIHSCVFLKHDKEQFRKKNNTVNQRMTWIPLHFDTVPPRNYSPKMFIV